MSSHPRTAGVLGVVVALLAAVAVVLPARAATVPPLAVTVPQGALLTLPAGDRFRDSVPLTVTASRAWTVDILAVGRTATVVLAARVPLTAATGGYRATVRASDRALHRGTWTVRVRRSGHPSTSAVAARHLRVGSGIARSLSVAPPVRTYYPYRDGHLDTVSATVTARDETGAAIPVHGTVRLVAGTTTRSVAVSGSAATVARISVPGLRLGSAALSARAAGPAGPALTSSRLGLVLAATGVTKTSVQPATTEVDPVLDGLADSLAVKVSGTSSIGAAVPVTGSVRVLAPDGSTVRTWPLSTSKTQTVTWNGRLGDGRLVPGSYRLAVSMKGPEGATRTAIQWVSVSTYHLPYRVQDLLTGGSGNQQGLAVSGRHLYVSTDLTGGLARIDEYDDSDSGALLHASEPLPLGHAAELAVQESSGHLYVANGGPATPTEVFSVDPADGAVLDTYDLRDLGYNGMVAFDQVSDRMLVFAGSEGAYTVTQVELDHTLGASVPVRVDGIPQGIDLVHGEIWIYTSLAGTGAGNRITRIDPATGGTLGTIQLAMNGEGEGLAYDPGTDTVFVGAHSGNRVGVLRPVADE